MDKEQQSNILRERRTRECFSIVNRGKLWYDTLSNEQIEELGTWYQLWLAAPDTLEAPQKLTWL